MEISDLKSKLRVCSFFYLVVYSIFFIIIAFVTKPQANALYNERQQVKQAEISKIVKTLQPKTVESAVYTKYNDRNYSLQFVKDHQKQSVDLEDDNTPVISSNSTAKLYSFYYKDFGADTMYYATDKTSLAETIYTRRYARPIFNGGSKFQSRFDVIVKMSGVLPFFLFIFSLAGLGFTLDAKEKQT